MYDSEMEGGNVKACMIEVVGGNIRAYMIVRWREGMLPMGMYDREVEQGSIRACMVERWKAGMLGHV